MAYLSPSSPTFKTGKQSTGVMHISIEENQSTQILHY